MIRNLLAFTLLVQTLACGGSALAQEGADAQPAKRSSFVALPYAFYSPETKFAFGAGSIYSWRSRNSLSGSRPSSMKIAATFTQKKQLIVALVPELYFKDESYYLYGSFAFYHYPDKFWGIGNDMPDEAEEDYSMDYVKTFFNLQKRVARGLYIGGRYQFEHIELIETADGGMLKNGAIPGSEPGGGSASGLGFIVNYDTRNNVYYPSRGRYFQLYGVFFEETIGSDYTFNTFTLDLREYRSAFGNHVIAFQSLGIVTGGTPPLQMTALLGGSYWMRGYFAGRYRDKNMIAFQTEYRFPIAWRFGGAAFAGLGDVAPEIGAFRLKEFKYSLGFGVRFMFDTQEKINARLDFGFGRYGNNGFYVMVTEAF